MRCASGAASVPIIEDACQAIGAEYRGAAGRARWALMGCFSYYPTKNLGGWGDGGLITTNDAELAAKLRILRDHGQNPRYHHSLVGINSRLDAIQAAVLNVKLPHLDDWAAGREQNARRYAAQFARLGVDRHIGLPQVADGVRERVEPVHDPRARRPPRCAAAAPERSQDRLGRVLPDSAAPAEVLRGRGATSAAACRRASRRPTRC